MEARKEGGRHMGMYEVTCRKTQVRRNEDEGVGEGGFHRLVQVGR